MHEDVKKRAKWYLDNILSVGAYTQTMGIPIVRESVANYIARIDEVPKPSIDQIMITEGAGEGPLFLLKMLMCHENDAVLAPVPLYPMYGAAINLAGGEFVPYYLDE